MAHDNLGKATPETTGWAGNGTGIGELFNAAVDALNVTDDKVEGVAKTQGEQGIVLKNMFPSSPELVGKSLSLVPQADGSFRWMIIPTATAANTSFDPAASGLPVDNVQAAIVAIAALVNSADHLRALTGTRKKEQPDFYSWVRDSTITFTHNLGLTSLEARRLRAEFIVEYNSVVYENTQYIGYASNLYWALPVPINVSDANKVVAKTPYGALGSVFFVDSAGGLSQAIPTNSKIKLLLRY